MQALASYNLTQVMDQIKHGSGHAAEVIGYTDAWLESDHPVCGAKGGFAEIFLMPQPPLLTRRGMSYKFGSVPPGGR
jgi:hypothetical protein